METATVGREGFVGLPVFLGAVPPTERALVTVGGRALRIDLAAFRKELQVIDGPLQAVLRRYTQAMCTQLARNAACNRVHTVRQRTARWLLMTADRVDGPTFGLTQDTLAETLAVRRASVSEVAVALAAEGCISYRAGTVTILDRTGIEAIACDCYQVIAEAGRAALAAG